MPVCKSKNVPHIFLQFAHTIFNTNQWPFAAHNMFCELEPLQKEILRVVLIDGKGIRQVVHPGRTIPIEYFRTQSLFRNVYQNSLDEERKRAFSKIVLERLNSRPWYIFDEMMLPARPSEGSVFIGMNIILQQVDFSRGG